MTVLRTLPQLQKLDNVSVTQEELREASRKGRVLSHPEDPQDSEEEQYANQGQYQRYEEYAAEEEYSPQRSPPRQEPEYEQEEADDYYEKGDSPSINNHQEYSPPLQPSPPRRESVRMNYSPEQEYAERKNNYEQEYPRHSQQYYDKSPTNNNSNDEASDGSYRDSKLVASQSTNSMKEYSNGDKYHSHNNYRANEGNDISSHTHETVTRRERYNCPAAHQPPFNRRPVTRNSNILSAVLCLVKELDYPSLEVVEMAVRCRMDELEE
ncbi:hypothetical protein FQA39_LY15427 [Lamprigera yunnana]|nr:hypothetical protein FQA39_LY15427 [Lamprigera yunnana]